jgi:hypothetical protein
MFRTFTKDYAFSTDLDVQEAADAHLILLCRFLTSGTAAVTRRAINLIR